MRKTQKQMHHGPTIQSYLCPMHTKRKRAENGLAVHLGTDTLVSCASCEFSSYNFDVDGSTESVNHVTE